MSDHPTDFQGSITDAIRDSIVESIAGAEVQVQGSGGHFTIEVTSSAFEGMNTLAKQRLVYKAITHLMAGDRAPVHAVDKLITRIPE